MPGFTARNGWRMTGSAGRADRFSTRPSYIRVGAGGERAGSRSEGRLADDGKRFCDLDLARNVVYRLAPQDNLLHN